LAGPPAVAPCSAAFVGHSAESSGYRDFPPAVAPRSAAFVGHSAESSGCRDFLPADRLGWVAALLMWPSAGIAASPSRRFGMIISRPIALAEPPLF